MQPQTVNTWKNRGIRMLPERRLMEAAAEITQSPYSRVLDVALVDLGYRDVEEVRESGAHTQR